MRILLSCLQSVKRYPLPAYDFWRSYFTQGMIEAGHEVVEVPNVDWVEAFTHSERSALESWRARTWEAVEAFLRRQPAQKPVDLFIGYLYPKQVDVLAIRELQRRGIPCVNFFCDNVREFAKVPKEYQPFALHWVPEFEAVSMYRDAGLSYIHAPMPCWISPALRQAPCLETEPATFIGSADILRRDLLGRALNGGADFVVRGPGWTAIADTNGSRLPRSLRRIIHNQLDFVKERGLAELFWKTQTRIWPLNSPVIDESRIKTPVFGGDYVRVTRESTVTIGVNRVPTTKRPIRRPLVYSRLRDIEAPMMGACYLTEWTQGLEHMYDLGTEIESYRTAEELVTKLNQLHLDPARRAAMRQRAQRRALSKNSVRRSIARIASHFGLC